MRFSNWLQPVRAHRGSARRMDPTQMHGGDGGGESTECWLGAGGEDAVGLTSERPLWLALTVFPK